MASIYDEQIRKLAQHVQLLEAEVLELTKAAKDRDAVISHLTEKLNRVEAEKAHNRIVTVRVDSSALSDSIAQIEAAVESIKSRQHDR